MNLKHQWSKYKNTIFFIGYILVGIYFKELGYGLWYLGITTLILLVIYWKPLKKMMWMQAEQNVESWEKRWNKISGGKDEKEEKIN